MIFNTENIVDYLQDETALKNADSTALQLFVAQYPYSGLIQLLYCKYLHLHNDVKLEEQLENCSLVVADRKKVYEILFQPTLQQQIIAHETAVEKVETAVEETIVSAIPTKEEKENSVLIEETAESATLSELEEKQISPTRKTLDELEQNILTEAVNASIQIDISQYAKEAQEEEKIQPEITEEETERTFIHWFDKPRLKKEKKTTSTLIDEFIKSGNKKEKDSATVFSPTNVAKLSLVSNTQFVTETLATIYAKQGQIDKAIEIYQQLSLKNPEKKTFFASRIRFLKEKQQYNK